VVSVSLALATVLTLIYYCPPVGQGVGVPTDAKEPAPGDWQSPRMDDADDLRLPLESEATTQAEAFTPGADQ